MSLIDQLPNEILTLIFLLWQNLELHHDSRKSSLRPLAGLLVDRHWNALINSTPEFWSTIVVPMPEGVSLDRWNRADWDRALCCTQRYVSASAAVPLTWVFTSVVDSVPQNLSGAYYRRVDERYMDDIQAILEENASRIENLVLNCLDGATMHILRLIHNRQTQFPILRRCLFDISRLYWSPRAVNVTQLLGAPALHHLGVGHISNSPIPTNLPCLRTVDLELSYHRLLELFASAPALEGVFVEIDPPSATDPQPARHTFRDSMRMANLTTLALTWRVGCLTLLDLPEMPALRQLDLQAYAFYSQSEDEEREELAAISIFLRRQSESLRTLILSLFFLKAGLRAAEETTLSVLPFLPQLEYLGLALMGRTSTLNVWKHLLRLGAKRAPDAPPLLPRLSTFHLVSSFKYAPGDLQNLVYSKALQSGPVPVFSIGSQSWLVLKGLSSGTRAIGRHI